MTPSPAPPFNNVARRLKALRQDRRGATAAFFGVASLVVIGFAALATEVGRWYDIRRDLQNVADVAAIAGAKRFSVATNILAPVQTGINAEAQARVAAIDAASRNGYTITNADISFPNLTFTVNPPPGSVVAPPPLSVTAISVTVNRDENKLLTRLFPPATTTQRITATGVAGLINNGNACILALEGGLIMGGSTNIQAPGCVIASNRTGNNSIRVNGNPVVVAASLESVGTCTGCTSSNRISLTNGVFSTPGVPDPYADLKNIPLPLDISTQSGPQNNLNSTWRVADALAASGLPMRNDPLIGDYYVFGSNVDIGNGTVDLLPGTYFFRNGAGLEMRSGRLICSTCTQPPVQPTTPGSPQLSIAGSGVTLVFLGPNAARGLTANPGDIDISASAEVVLKAPSTGPYRGMLIYRQEPATSQIGGGNGTQEVSIQGNSNSNIAGAIYVPKADVDWRGNASLARAGCLVVVGGSIDSGGNSAFGAGRCDDLRVGLVPRTQVYRLLQ
ncbi:TadE/TadG family type IV pilus assembly protein [Falsiroseomonas oryziterrae]|uniref:TadE/TadG family type IV pilus assembly protein n=1 Tax=Falsiroseomonas oryziterrae TaxID=2911368 RepID=UPI001F16C1BA|nr:TadE/TadG family type IV pilus assembly protein [Roseomonas sp. NPKOSM-4]